MIIVESCVNPTRSVSTSTSYIFDEVLCALDYSFTQLPKISLMLLLKWFYSTEEISLANFVLFTTADVQQPVTRRGANKRYADSLTRMT